MQIKGEKNPLISNSDLCIKLIFYITVKFSTNYKNVNTEAFKRNLLRSLRKIKEITASQLLL